MTGVIAVHVGAGNHSDLLKPKYRQLMSQACLQGVNALKNGKSAVDAVVAAIKVLEDSCLTNAGRGSSLSLEGTVECDASIMDGESLQHTAIGAVSNIKNPIEVPHKMLVAQSNPLPGGLIQPSFLTGSGAHSWAVKNGIKTCQQKDLITAKAKKVHEASKQFIQNLGSKKRKLSEADISPERLDTVGAACLDMNGNVVSAVSSGGIILKHPGRVGQASVYGCGCWAENKCNNSEHNICVTTSGCGEHLVRTSFARLCATAASKTDDLGIELAETIEKEFIKSKFLRDVSSPLGGALIIKCNPSCYAADLFWLHSTSSMGIGYMSTDCRKAKTFFSTLPEEQIGSSINLNFATVPLRSAANGSSES